MTAGSSLGTNAVTNLTFREPKQQSKRH